MSDLVLFAKDLHEALCEHRMMINLLDYHRNINEAPLDTLKRILRERIKTENILGELGIAHRCMNSFDIALDALLEKYKDKA